MAAAPVAKKPARLRQRGEPAPAALLHAALENDSRDAGRRVLVAFVQQALGCGCPDETIRTAVVSVNARPLRDYLTRQARQGGWEVLAGRLNPHLGLPEATPWPPAPPWRWSAEVLARSPEGVREALQRLKRLCGAKAGLLIDVPGRAMFCLAVGYERPAPAARLETLHAAAVLVKELAGYNRVRLFTLSVRPPRPLPPKILDAALSWESVLAVLRRAGAQEAARELSASIFS